MFVHGERDGPTRCPTLKILVRVLVAIALLCFTPLLAHAERTCADDSIEEVAGDGAIITMLSGSIWKVDDVDRVDSALWLGTEDVLICHEVRSLKGGGTFVAYTIINKEENGEEVSVDRIGTK